MTFFWNKYNNVTRTNMSLILATTNPKCHKGTKEKPNGLD
jgi:hypothetical protein